MSKKLLVTFVIGGIVAIVSEHFLSPFLKKAASEFLAK